MLCRKAGQATHPPGHKQPWSQEELGKLRRGLTRLKGLLMNRKPWTCMTGETHWVKADAGEAVCSPREAVHWLRAAVVPHIHLLPSCSKRVPLPVVVDAPTLGQRKRTCRDVLCRLACPPLQQERLPWCKQECRREKAAGPSMRSRHSSPT